MRDFLTHVNRSFILLLVIFLGACASWSSRMSHDYMQQAIESNKKGDIYEAFTHAVQAYQYDNSNEEAKRFIKENLHSAIATAVDSFKKAKVSTDELRSFREKVNQLAKTQGYLKDTNFIQVNIVDTNDIKVKYETILLENLLKDIAATLEKEDAEAARKQIDKLSELDLPKTEQFNSAVNRLQHLFLTQGKFSIVIDFTKKNKDYLSKESFRETYFGLLNYAESDEAANKKRALETYLFLSEIEKDNPSVAHKISTLRNELLTMFAVLELENNTDEFLPVNNNDFISLVKSGIDSKESLSEVILKDDGLNDIKDRAINYDFFRNKSDLDIRFENNIRYLIIPKIATIKINRQSPSMQTKNANWKGTTWQDGVSAGLAEYQAYGRYKVQYYQYDEYTAKVNGRVVIDVIVYDLKQRKIVLKERLESFKEDSAIWAENPMAVGIINKIPATLCPPEMQSLLNQKRSIMNDNELKKDLIEEISAEIVVKAKSLLAGPDRNSQESRH